jgi:transcriptional regulator with XRE-family HTH domain
MTESAAAFDLRKLLTKHGLTVQDVSRVVGVSITTLTYWRRGLRRPSSEHCKLIERKLGIPKYLLRPDLWEPPAAAAPQPRRKAA